MHYEGTVYSEYLSCPQVHLTSWGDVLQSAQSRQAVLWVVAIQIIRLLQLVAVLKARLRIFPFSDEIIENTCNFVNSCSNCVKISASQSLCKSEGDCILRI